MKEVTRLRSFVTSHQETHRACHILAGLRSLFISQQVAHSRPHQLTHSELAGNSQVWLHQFISWLVRCADSKWCCSELIVWGNCEYIMISPWHLCEIKFFTGLCYNSKYQIFILFSLFFFQKRFASRRKMGYKSEKFLEKIPMPKIPRRRHHSYLSHSWALITTKIFAIKISLLFGQISTYLYYRPSICSMTIEVEFGHDIMAIVYVHDVTKGIVCPPNGIQDVRAVTLSIGCTSLCTFASGKVR